MKLHIKVEQDLISNLLSEQKNCVALQQQYSEDTFLLLHFKRISDSVNSNS